MLFFRGLNICYRGDEKREIVSLLSTINTIQARREVTITKI